MHLHIILATHHSSQLARCVCNSYGLLMQLVSVQEDLGIGKVGLMLSFTEELLRLFD